MGGVESATSVAVGSVLPVTMRATPTVSFGSGVRLYANGVLTPTLSSQRCSTTNIGCLIAATGMTAGQAAYIYNAANSNSYVDASAEL